jgi:hypothetical protein
MSGLGNGVAHFLAAWQYDALYIKEKGEECLCLDGRFVESENILVAM